MKKFSETLNDDKPFWVDEINKILRSEGWPELEYDDENDKYKSIDEDTVITFETDEDDGKPFISKVVCNFVCCNPIHLRDLNGLVSLYTRVQKYNFSL